MLLAYGLAVFFFVGLAWTRGATRIVMAVLGIACLLTGIALTVGQ